MSVPTIKILNHSSQSASVVQVKNRVVASLRERVVLFALLAVFIGLAIEFRNPFVGQWDSFDYVTKTVRYQVSDLAFGRPVFLWMNMGAWTWVQRYGLDVVRAGLVGQALVMLFAVLGLVSFYFCVKPVAGIRLALFAVAWLAVTPMYLAYSGMVMTEIPSLTCLTAAVAVVLHWRRTQRLVDLLLSALLFGVAIHMREQLITAAAVFPFVMLIDQRSTWSKKVMAVIIHTASYTLFVLSVLYFLWKTDPDYPMRIRGWMSVFNLLDHGLLKQFFFLGKFAFANCGVALVISILTFRFWSEVLTVRAMISGMGLLPLFALLPNADLGIQPRYELIAVPAFILTAVVGLQRVLSGMKWPLKNIMLVILLMAQGSFSMGGWVLLARFNGVSSERRMRLERLLTNVPQDSVFIAGAYTPILEFYRQSGIRPSWEIIRSGWEWRKADLSARVVEALEAHRSVFFVSDAKAWDYLQEERVDVNALRSQFQFVRVDPGMERIQSKSK